MMCYSTCEVFIVNKMQWLKYRNCIPYLHNLMQIQGKSFGRTDVSKAVVSEFENEGRGLTQMFESSPKLWECLHQAM